MTTPLPQNEEQGGAIAPSLQAVRYKGHGASPAGFWHSPLMVIPVTAVGAWAGWWAWPVIAVRFLWALDVVYRGFAIILINFLCWAGAVLGGATAFACVMSRGNWRRVAGGLLIIGAMAALVWSAPLAWDCMRCEGRRFALVVWGLPMLWVSVLGAWGCRMVRTCDRSAAGRSVPV